MRFRTVLSGAGLAGILLGYYITSDNSTQSPKNNDLSTDVIDSTESFVYTNNQSYTYNSAIPVHSSRDSPLTNIIIQTPHVKRIHQGNIVQIIFPQEDIKGMTDEEVNEYIHSKFVETAQSPIVSLYPETDHLPEYEQNLWAKTEIVEVALGNTFDFGLSDPVKLFWDAPKYTNNISGYNVYFTSSSINDTIMHVLPVQDVTEFEISGLDNYQQYTFWVSTISKEGLESKLCNGATHPNPTKIYVNNN